MSFRLRAHAKVNLSLEVEPIGRDGFHPYRSTAVSADLCDDLNVVPGPPGSGIRVTCDTGLEDTLITAGIRAVAEIAGRPIDVRVNVTKRIPVGAGLGGGSADAAAAMIAATRLVDATVDFDDLLTAGAKIGTDVPFCLTGGHAICHGRGELVEPREGLPPFGLLIAVPPIDVSTSVVFSAFDDDPVPAPPVQMAAWVRGVLPDCSFRNDLEPAAVRAYPELATWKSTVERVTGAPALLTGSGSGFVVLAEGTAEVAPFVPGLKAAGMAVWASRPAPAGVEVLTPIR